MNHHEMFVAQTAQTWSLAWQSQLDWEVSIRSDVTRYEALSWAETLLSSSIDVSCCVEAVPVFQSYVSTHCDNLPLGDPITTRQNLVAVETVARHLNVYFAYTKYTDEVKDSLPDGTVMVDCSDATAYWKLLCTWWEQAEDFLIIEHDIKVHPRVVTDMLTCPNPWCVNPYKEKGSGHWLTWCLGCTRFRSEIMMAFPEAVKAGGPMGYNGIDARITGAFRRGGIQPPACLHLPEVRHLNV